MMMKDPREEMHSADRPPCERDKETLDLAELAQLADPEKQAEYRREYLAQLKRRACPGCGEHDGFY